MKINVKNTISLYPYEVRIARRDNASRRYIVQKSVSCRCFGALFSSDKHSFNNIVKHFYSLPPTSIPSMARVAMFIVLYRKNTNNYGY